MGKKSRKKKTGKSAVSSSPPTPPPAAGGTGAALIALPSSCFHGSNLADFKNPDYAEAMQAYILMINDVIKIGPEVGQHNMFLVGQRLEKFNNDHEHLTKHDANFRCFVFAYCAHRYLKGAYSSINGSTNMLLHWGIQMRYQVQVDKGVSTDPGSESYEKGNKYKRDIQTERGIIKCLARETPCNCMDQSKAAAQGMDKTNSCDGCNKLFSKTSLFFCTGCQFTKYCSKACQVNGWPNHRSLCSRRYCTK